MSEWQAALDAYELAHADLDALGDDYSNVEADFYATAQFEALDKLLLTPVPDMAAFARKLRIFVAEDAWEFTRKEHLFAALIRDADRFSEQLRGGPK